MTLPLTPATHHSALPGAVLMAVGLWLIVWALEGWGLVGKRATATSSGAATSAAAGSVGHGLGAGVVAAGQGQTP